MSICFCISPFTRLTLKRLGLEGRRGGGGGGGSILNPVFFSKKVNYKPWFFATFNIISKHVLLENFIDFSRVVQKI